MIILCSSNNQLARQFLQKVRLQLTLDKVLFFFNSAVRLPLLFHLDTIDLKLEIVEIRSNNFGNKTYRNMFEFSTFIPILCSSSFSLFLLHFQKSFELSRVFSLSSFLICYFMCIINPSHFSKFYVQLIFSCIQLYHSSNLKTFKNYLKKIYSNILI